MFGFLEEAFDSRILLFWNAFINGTLSDICNQLLLAGTHNSGRWRLGNGKYGRRRRQNRRSFRSWNDVFGFHEEAFDSRILLFWNAFINGTLSDICNQLLLAGTHNSGRWRLGNGKYGRRRRQKKNPAIRFGVVLKGPEGLYLCSNAKANFIRPIGPVSLSNKYRPDGPGTKFNPSVLQRYTPSGPFDTTPGRKTARTNPLRSIRAV